MFLIYTTWFQKGKKRITQRDIDLLGKFLNQLLGILYPEHAEYTEYFVWNTPYGVVQTQLIFFLPLMCVDFHNADVPCEGRGYAEIGPRWRTPYMW